ncbi:MAG: DUF11 domain-containing protein [Candidatus Promineifilaceae bacterium]
MNIAANTGERKTRVLFSFLIASLMLVMVFQTLFAQGREQMPSDLTGSSKGVDHEEALPGSELEYTVVISNSGEQPAYGVVLTDTLVTEMTYVAGSLSVSGGGLYGESGGVITWTGAVNNGTEIVIRFDTLLTDAVAAGTIITNTAVIGYEASTLEFPAVTTIITETNTIVFLPFIAKGYPTVNLNWIGRPTSANAWTVSWSVSDPIGVTGYEIQEDNDPSFSNPTAYETGSSELFLDRQPPVSVVNTYFYRVRAVGNFGSGEWSQTRAIIANYRDDFNNPGTGWAMRREDTDHIENQVRYENGEWVHEQDSSWDYLIAGPMVLAPELPYRLEMRARLVGADNLNSYGLIFGGDWNAQDPCPVWDFSTCFNQYYRLSIIWFGDSNQRLRAIVKRINNHDPENNHGRGVTIIPAVDVPTQGPSSSYQNWAVEVYQNGTIKLFINGNFVAQTVDTNYIDRPYFGTFSATDEYNGLEAHFDWYQVTALP